MATGSVAILYRVGSSSVSPGRSSPVILGVFEAPNHARDYVERMGLAESGCWQMPRIGHWQWELETDEYCYVVETYPVRTSGDTLAELIHQNLHASFDSLT